MSKMPKRAPAEYIGQTKQALRDSLGEHRRGIRNKTTTDAVPQHFNQRGHKLINSNRESICRVRETLYIEMAKTMQLHGINREDDR